MPKYTGCCCSILKKISGKQRLLYSNKAVLSPHPAQRTAISHPLPSSVPQAHGVSEGAQRAGSPKGKTCHKPAPRPAWRELICTAPGKLAQVLEGRSRPSNLLKTKDLRQQLRCVLHCQTFNHGARKTLAFYCTSLVVEEGRTYPSMDRPWHWNNNILTMNRHCSSCK